MKTRIDENAAPASLVLQAGICLAIVFVIAAATISAQGQPPAAPKTTAEIVEELVLGNHILVNEGACDGLGHISVRHNEKPDRFLLSRGMAPAVVAAADIMEYDLEGKPVDQQGRSMYGERFIHAAIYKARPDVKSVVHCHTPSVLPFANSDVPMRPMYQMSAFLINGAPVFEIRKVPGAKGMLVNNMTSGDALAAVLGKSTVVLMRGHGLVVIGESIPEAVSNAIHLDVNAQMQTQAAALGGKITYLADDEASGNPYDRFWDHWKVRLKNR